MEDLAVFWDYIFFTASFTQMSTSCISSESCQRGMRLKCYGHVVTDQRTDERKWIPGTKSHTHGVLFQHSEQISIVRTTPWNVMDVCGINYFHVPIYSDN